MAKMGRPPIDPDRKRVPPNALVDPDTIDLLDDYAMQERISRGRAIDAAVKLLPIKRRRAKG